MLDGRLSTSTSAMSAQIAQVIGASSTIELVEKLKKDTLAVE
jgi:hypothetical protein